MAGAETALDGTSPRPPVSLRHLRWLLPISLALLAFVVFALVEALHDTKAMSGSTEIQSAGFYRPADTTPVAFSLPVLQPAASGPPAGAASVTMSSLRGKPVVLNMWSSSCTICKSETPAIESVSRRTGGSVQFVGIDTLDQRATALAFLRRYGVTYLQLSDADERAGAGYGIPGLPVTVFVSGSGKVVGEYLGGLSTKTLTHYLAALFGTHVPSASAARAADAAGRAGHGSTVSVVGLLG